jgi:hypothetical protein
MAAEIEGSKKRNDMTVVAEDKNWRDYIAKELKSADNWEQDWGFLSSGKLEDGITEMKPKSKDERIAELEAQLNSMKSRDYVTSSTCIGRGENLEMFPMKHFNI